MKITKRNKKKLRKDLHLSDPNYSNILNEKEKLIWTNLKKLYEEKYKFD